MTDARVRLQQAENVLLHWDDDALLPTCKLSDFGNATSDSYHVERRESPLCLLRELQHTVGAFWLVV